MQNDTGIPTYSFTNEPYEDVWLGNLFENEEMVTITSVEIYWDVYENAHDFKSHPLESSDVISPKSQAM